MTNITKPFFDQITYFMKCMDKTSKSKINILAKSQEGRKNQYGKMVRKEIRNLLKIFTGVHIFHK